MPIIHTSREMLSLKNLTPPNVPLKPILSPRPIKKYGTMHNIDFYNNKGEDSFDHLNNSEFE